MPYTPMFEDEYMKHLYEELVAISLIIVLAMIIGWFIYWF